MPPEAEARVCLSKEVSDALRGRHFWHLATVGSDGAPQSSTVWVDLRDGRILVNSALGRAKSRNLEQDGRVALSWHSPDNPYESIALKGRVIANYTGPDAEADIDRLAKKYTDLDRYSGRREGEERISFLIEAISATHMGSTRRGSEG